MSPSNTKETRAVTPVKYSCSEEEKLELKRLAAAHLLEQRAQNKGRLHHKAMNDMIGYLAKVGVPNVNRNQLIYQMRKLEQDLKALPQQTEQAAGFFSMTPAQIVARTTGNKHSVVEIHPVSVVSSKIAVDDDEMSELDSTGKEAWQTDEEDSEGYEDDDPNAEEDLFRIEQCMVSITKEAIRVREERAKQGHPRFAKGYIAELIQEKKKEVGLEASVRISEKAVRSRLKNGVVHLRRRGCTSPYQCIEERVVQVCNWLQEVGQPLTSIQGLELANEVLEKEAKELYEKRGPVDKPFWRAFIKRNASRILPYIPYPSHQKIMD